MRCLVHSLIGIFLFAAVLAPPQTADAQLRLPFQKQKPAANQPTSPGQGEAAISQLTDAAGPWLIMCGSFQGEDRVQKALRLADELQSQYQLTTYLYEKKFDIEQDVKNAIQQQAVPRSQLPQGPNVVLPEPTRLTLAAASEVEEVAVLVGDFPSLDDGRARQVLAAVKSIEPTSPVSTAPVREGQGAWASDDFTNENSGSLKQAFLLPNPLLPDAYFNQSTVDSFVVKMNKGMKYSLLKNKGQYTVRVATFSGGSSFGKQSISQQLKDLSNEKKKFGRSKRVSDLETAAMKATALARYLRTKTKKKPSIEAYEFHDRDTSYVCVGSFDWVTRPSATGGKETNPEVTKLLREFSGQLVSVQGNREQARSYPLPTKYTNVGICCDAAPEVITVPQAPAGSMASRFMGKFR